MEEKRSVKKAMIMSVIAIVLILIAFSCLIVAAVMQERGYADEVVIPVALAGFFGGNVIAIVLLFKAYPALLRSDCARMEARYAGKELTCMSFPARESLAQIFISGGFQYIQEGYYRRKKLSFLKDSVCYYVRMTEDTDIENALRREIERLYQMERREKNLCLLLFVYMDEIGESDKELLKELGKNTIVMESVLNPNISMSVLLIAIDRRRDTGYYMEIGKHGGITLYAYGCRMIGKLFGQEKQAWGAGSGTVL